MSQRCELCRINKTFCYCEHVKELNTNTLCTLIVHHRERFLTTNTAFLAQRVLKQSKLFFRGIKDNSIDHLSFEEKGHQSLFLFPDEESLPLDESFMEKYPGPYNLIVPDGSWSQARKFKKRIPYLQTIPSVHIPFKFSSEYYLRRQTKKENLCTYEAIARAYGILEDTETESVMLEIFRNMVSKILISRSSNYMPL